MIKKIRENHRYQLVLGLLIGIAFGFFLQRGGATRYDVIVGQLLLKDWTVAKIILSAVATGMIGVYFMHARGLVRLHKIPGSVGSTLVGGLIFGVGFGLLGYCPGTAMGAVGQGSLDALLGGVPGMLLGSGVYAALYPKLKNGILDKGAFGDKTVPELLGMKAGVCVVVAVGLIVGILAALETVGL